MSTIDMTAREDGELGQWQLFSRPSHPLLVEYAVGYHGYDQRVRRPGHHLTTATPLLPLVISFGGRHRVTSRSGATTVNSFLAGVHEGTGEVAADAFYGIQVDLTPVGAYRLLGGSIRPMKERTVPLEGLLGRSASRLVERLGNTGPWSERFDLLDRFLVERIQSNRLPRPEVVACWDRMVSSGGNLRVSDLAAETGWSRRHLTQKVTDQFGLPPKRLARLIRYRRATSFLERSDLPLGVIALKVGYYDQAHFTNEVRLLSGRTPAQFASLRRPA